MRFMNEHDIETAVARFGRHPVLGPAARFLQRYKDQVNQHSDGWPYWSPPVKAAARLIELLEDATARHYRGETLTATAADVRRALGPIKAFMTRRGTAAGMTLPEVQ